MVVVLVRDVYLLVVVPAGALDLDDGHRCSLDELGNLYLLLHALQQVVDVLQQSERVGRLLAVGGNHHHVDVGLRQAQLGREGPKNLDICAQLVLDLLANILDQLVEEGALLSVFFLDDLGFVLDVLLQVVLEFVGSHDSVLELPFLILAFVQFFLLQLLLLFVCEFLHDQIGLLLDLDLVEFVLDLEVDNFVVSCPHLVLTVFVPIGRPPLF